MRWILVATTSLLLITPVTAQSSDQSGRTQQRQGESSAITNNSDAPRGSGLPGDLTSTQSAIRRSSTGNMSLSPDELNQVKAAAGKLRRHDAEFTVSVGAAVPRQIETKELPAELDVLKRHYSNSEYAIVRGRLLVVDRQTRRITAIIPLS